MIATHKSNHTLGVLDEVPRFLHATLVFIQQHQVNEHVARIQLPGSHGLLATTHLHHLFDRHEHFLDVLVHLLRLEATFDAVLYLLLLSGEGMNDKPLAVHLKVPTSC